MKPLGLISLHSEILDTLHFARETRPSLRDPGHVALCVSGHPHPACHGLHSELPRRHAWCALGCWFWCVALVADAVAAFISGGRVSTSFFVCAQSLVDISLCTVAAVQAWLGLEHSLAACMRPSRCYDHVIPTSDIRSPSTDSRSRSPTSTSVLVFVLLDSTSSPLLPVAPLVSDLLASISPCNSTQPERHRASRNEQRYTEALGPWTPSIP
jgi:hypothetical protein